MRLPRTRLRLLGLRLRGGSGRRRRFFPGATRLRRQYFIEPRDDLTQGQHHGASGQGRGAADKQAPATLDLDYVPAAGHRDDPANHESNPKTRYLAMMMTLAA